VKFLRGLAAGVQREGVFLGDEFEFERLIIGGACQWN
jgi:hypothetical protein